MAELPVVFKKENVVNAVSDFNTPLTGYFSQLNLPVDNVLYPIKDREIVFQSFELAIDTLSIEKRQKAMYLTRFAASIAAGLFDGALTYLWDETIKSIRNMVVEFDLVHFYIIASDYNSRYKGLKEVEELEEISEYDLITICNRIGLLDNHVYEVFKHINYMRNHSSSAHPNENGIKAFDILSWLQNCIDYAINATPNKSSIQMKKLFYHMRNEVIPIDDFPVIGVEIQKLPSLMIDDMLTNLFGTFTDEKTKAEVRDNIRGIAPYAWNSSSEEKKYELGEKFGYFRKNGDVRRKDLANEFLNIVNGQSYKDEDSLASELRETLNSLKSAHFGRNNFYNEYPWVIILDSKIPESGIIPKSVKNDWIKIIVLCYLGNGLGYREGVDESAVVYYQEYIDSFGDEEIFTFLNLLDDNELMWDSTEAKVKRRFKMLCNQLCDQAHNMFVKQALDIIISTSAPMAKICTVTKLKEKIAQIKL